MAMRLLLIAFALLFAWLFRYDFEVGPRHGQTMADVCKLDRWTHEITCSRIAFGDSAWARETDEFLRQRQSDKQ